MSLVNLLILFVLLPVVWSGVVWGGRQLSLRSGRPGERAERLFLLLMVLPVVLGAIALAVPGLFPYVYVPLPEMGGMGEGGGAAREAAAIEAGYRIPWQSIFVLGLALAYGAGVLLGLVRLGAGLWRVINIARQAERRDEDVGISNAPVSPFALPGGKVILPRRFVDTASTEELDLIIAHERAHIRRRDPVWFLVLAALDAVFWMSPFFRSQTKACRFAAELACDEAVTRAAPQMRKAYAATLIRVLKHTAGHAPTCAPAVFSPKTQGDYQVRLSTIMRPEPVRRNRRAVLALVALAVALVPVAAVQGAYASGAASTDFPVRPLEGRMTSPFGQRLHPVDGKEQVHLGTDIAAAAGTPIVAPAPGKVRFAGRRGGYGIVVEIDHENGYVTRYAQLQEHNVEKGDRLRAGQEFAKVGSSGRSTGPHLHVEVILNGEHVDPETVLDLPAKKDGAPHTH